MPPSKGLNVHLRSTFRIPFTQKSPNENGPYKLYDVKFYPYYPRSTTVPIFAVVGTRQVFVCRPPTNPDESFAILTSLRDLEDLPDGSLDLLNSCEWNHIDPSQPLLSVAGSSGLIKVFNALTGDEFTTLVGHGVGIINDLATHPQHPSILASASMDSSIRIWDLRRTPAGSGVDEADLKENSCIIICGHGQGHKEGLLTVNWHPRGRYLISGAHDHMICVWSIPDLSATSGFWTEIAHPRRTAEKVRVIHYPHFISSAIHTNYVDHVQFYGDLVLSKAADEDKIVLWRIEGFNSRMTPPGDDAAPKTKEYLDTRSGFLPKHKPRPTLPVETSASQTNGDTAIDPSGRSAAPNANSSTDDPPNDWEDDDPPPFTRLLEFSIPDSTLFYMRFGLSTPSPAFPDLAPVLAAANLRSRVFFWDLLALERGHDEKVDQTAPGEGPCVPSSRSSSSSSPSISPPRPPATVVRAPDRNRDKYPLHDPFTPLAAHVKLTIPDFPVRQPQKSWELKLGFQGRAVGWSPDGRWCVVVGEVKAAGGEEGCGAIFERSL